MDTVYSEELETEVIELFLEAALDVFFGRYLFDVREKSSYYFTPDEKKIPYVW